MLAQGPHPPLLKKSRYTSSRSRMPPSSGRPSSRSIRHGRAPSSKLHYETCCSSRTAHPCMCTVTVFSSPARTRAWPICTRQVKMWCVLSVECFHVNKELLMSYSIAEAWV